MVIRTTLHLYLVPACSFRFTVTHPLHLLLDLKFLTFRNRLGTGIALNGTANCSYSVDIDGTQKAIGNPPYNTLYSVSGLNNIQHNITLVAQPEGNQTLSFDAAVISAPSSGS